MKTKTLIYILTKNGIPFYVGKTINMTRKYSHKYKYPNSVFEVIDEVSSDEWKFWESHYISLYRSWGFILVNKNSGGGGPKNMSTETKKKMSQSHLKMTDETRKKMSQSHIGKSTWNKGISTPSVVKVKISLSLKGRKSPRLGVVLSEETKMKLSESNKGKSRNKGKIPWNKGIKTGKRNISNSL